MNLAPRPNARRRMSLLAAVALTALVATGCAATQEPAAAPDDTTPAPAASEWAGETVSGIGSTETFPGVDFPIPADARSLVITFTCAGDSPFSVELGDSMGLGQSPLRRACGAPVELAWPIVDETGESLTVWIAEGVEWTAALRFSTAEFVVDEALAADCATFSGIISALASADNGNASGDIDEAEWTERVDAAAADLDTAADAAQTSLGDSFARLHDVISDPGRTVGAVLASSDASFDTIGQACGINQTPLVIHSEFGG